VAIGSEYKTNQIPTTERHFIEHLDEDISKVSDKKIDVPGPTNIVEMGEVAHKENQPVVIV
jgi:hypothetical protein